MIIKKGVFTKVTDDLEFFRTKDIRLIQPFLLRLVNKSSIILISSDKSKPRIEIPAISDGEEVKELIRIIVDKRRTDKKVRETDFE